MAFVPIEKSNAAAQVADAIRDAIVSGDLAEGAGLPSERELASSFAVNRGTVREALGRLEALGWVQIRHGGRTTVRDVLSSAGLHLLPFLLAPRGTPDPALVRDLLQVRVMILSWTARLAAQAPVASRDLGRLSSLVEALESGGGDVQALDFAFFEELIALSGNRVLGMLATLVRDAYLRHRAVFAPLYGPSFSAAPHRRALWAIEQGMADISASVMREYAEQALLLLATAERAP